MTTTGDPSVVPLRADQGLIGQRLGRYRISSSLGRGGMAEVFKATDDRLNREVAIKVVLPAYGSEPQLQQRFLREAQVVASLEHPHILPIYDFGEHQGLPFLVMPMIRGGTLADRLGGGPLEASRVAGWIHDLAQALDAAHAAGVLHRDVKPGNVLIGRDEHLFLADFGIARLCDATRLTRTGTVVGTPVYMAPEVAAGKPAEAASDQYSLAVMTYEMLAGRPPFAGENVLSILHQHATCPVPPITDQLAHLPTGVDRVLELGLAKLPAARPPSCRAFGEFLADQLPAASPETPPQAVSDQLPTLEMARDPTAAPALSTAMSSIPISPAPTSDAYTTLHATSDGPGKLRQWGLAGLLGGVVAVAGFLALRGMDRHPEMMPVGLEQAGVSATTATAETDPPAAGEQPATVPQSVADAPETQTAQTVPAASPEAPPSGPAESLAMASRPNVSRPNVSRPNVSRPNVSSAPYGATPTPGPERVRLKTLRSFTSRMTERDFKKVSEAARRMPDRGPNAGQGAVMVTYARGGLAYLGGDDSAATNALREALHDPRLVAFWGPSPLMLLAASVPDRHQLEPWELALGYGDPRGTAGGALDALLQSQPENGRLRFARALVHRLDAEHQAVIRHALPVFQQLEGGDAPEARGYLAQVIGDAYLGLDRDDEGLKWLRRSVEVGGPFRGIAAMRGAEAAREVRRPAAMAEFLHDACEAKVQPACRRLKSETRLSRNPS